MGMDLLCFTVSTVGMTPRLGGQRGWGQAQWGWRTHLWAELVEGGFIWDCQLERHSVAS